MNEAEWMKSDDPGKMLGIVHSLATDRKLRLLAVACCREGFDSSSEIVEAAELFADGLVTVAEYDKAMNDAGGQLGTFIGGYHLLDAATSPTRWRDACAGASKAGVATASMNRMLWHYTHPHYSTYIRELFGPLPFRRITIEPAWLSGVVANLAQAIYSDKAFDRLPILSDALEEAGCTDREVLGHLRDKDAVHVRGCFALDLILGKS